MNRVLLVVVFTALFQLGLPQDIVPVESGSIVVEDQFLRLNTCITKTYNLILTKEQFRKNPGIEAIAAISSLNLDSHLAFQFKYVLNCEQSRMNTCQFELSLERFNTIFDPSIKYELVIDFLLAYNLKTTTVNMTYFKQHFNPDQESYQRAVLIPQGFSDVSITGNVKQTKLSSNSILLTYSDPQQIQTVQTSMGWTLNKHFILYKVVYLFRSYNMVNNVRNIFAGFDSSSDLKVTAELYINSRSEILLDSSTGYANYFNLPLADNEAFADRRNYVIQHVTSGPSKANTETSGYFTRIMIALFFLLIAEVIFLLIRNIIKQKERETGIKSNVTVPQVFISFNESFEQTRQPEQKSEETPNLMESAGKLQRQEIQVQ